MLYNCRKKVLDKGTILKWHGAAPDSWFSHIAVEVSGTETSNEWQEAVSDGDYGKLK